MRFETRAQVESELRAALVEVVAGKAMLDEDGQQTFLVIATRKTRSAAAACGQNSWLTLWTGKSLPDERHAPSLGPAAPMLEQKLKDAERRLNAEANEAAVLREWIAALRAQREAEGRAAAAEAARLRADLDDSMRQLAGETARAAEAEATAERAVQEAMAMVGDAAKKWEDAAVDIEREKVARQVVRPARNAPSSGRSSIRSKWCRQRLRRAMPRSPSLLNNCRITSS